MIKAVLLCRTMRHHPHLAGIPVSTDRRLAGLPEEQEQARSVKTGSRLVFSGNDHNRAMPWRMLRRSTEVENETSLTISTGSIWSHEARWSGSRKISHQRGWNWHKEQWFGGPVPCRVSLSQSSGYELPGPGSAGTGVTGRARGRGSRVCAIATVHLALFIIA